MALFPDTSFPLSMTKCSGCSRQLTITDRAIVYDAVKPPLILGTCCFERAMGAVIQDWARTTDEDFGFYSPWASAFSKQAHQISIAAEKICGCYAERAKWSGKAK